MLDTKLEGIKLELFLNALEFLLAEGIKADEMYKSCQRVQQMGDP